MKVYEGSRVPIKAWTDGVPVEDSAMKQLVNLSSMPFVYKHIAAMPDVHWGMGATVGSVIATEKAIIPAAVGVDIGCGMFACKLPIRASDLPDDLSRLRSAIEHCVPHGRTNDGGSGDRGAWGDLPEFSGAFKIVEPTYNYIIEKHPELKPRKHPVHHLGTLGTGNHFIELCLDQNQDLWLMLHSGSRGIGNKIGNFFITKAKEEMMRYHLDKYLPDMDLAFLVENTEIFEDYVRAVNWAQEFAALNRAMMMTSVINVLVFAFPEKFHGIASPEVAINCHHNYVTQERHFGKTVWLTRKGAVSAQEDQLGIIPGSMGAKSFIVRGKGSRESFMSCSHGAGRAMGRNEAKKRFTLEDHIKATEGVECRKDEDVIDETPGAYKDIDAVMAAQADLVDIVYTLKQVLCVKG